MNDNLEIEWTPFEIETKEILYWIGKESPEKSLAYLGPRQMSANWKRQDIAFTGHTAADGARFYDGEWLGYERKLEDGVCGSEPPKKGYVIWIEGQWWIKNKDYIYLLRLARNIKHLIDHETEKPKHILTNHEGDGELSQEMKDMSEEEYHDFYDEGK